MTRYLSALPLACFIVMLAYACYGAAVLGHWPYYAHPDPKELPSPRLLTVATMAMLVGACSLVLLPLSYGIWRSVVALKHQVPRPHRTAVLLYFAGASLWTLELLSLFGRAPWHSITSWLLD